MTAMGNSGGRERRRHIRVRISVDAMIEIGAFPAQPCQVYNMSVGGALLELVQGIRLGEPATLHLDGFGPVRGHIARVTSTVMALAFEECDTPALAAFLDRRMIGLADEHPATETETAGLPGTA